MDEPHIGCFVPGVISEDLSSKHTAFDAVIIHQARAWPQHIPASSKERINGDIGT